MSDRQTVTPVASPCVAEMKVNESDSTALVESTAALSEPMESKTTLLKATEEKCVEKRIQKNKKRCWECKKKVGLTALECRCGYVFCGSHRFEDQHNCSFDFKTADRVELARRNPGGGAFSKLEKL